MGSAHYFVLRQGGGWIFITLLPRKSAHVYIITTYNRILHTNTPAHTSFEFTAPYAYHIAMNCWSAHKCVQQTAKPKAYHHNSSSSGRWRNTVGHEKYEESAGTFWRGTTQLHVKLQTSGSVLTSGQEKDSYYITSCCIWKLSTWGQLYGHFMEWSLWLCRKLKQLWGWADIWYWALFRETMVLLYCITVFVYTCTGSNKILAKDYCLTWFTIIILWHWLYVANCMFSISAELLTHSIIP